MERRPHKDDVQSQLFWLVDVIFACGESGLMHEAAHLRRALGHLGKYLEDSDAPALNRAISELGAFEELIAERKREPDKPD